MQFCRTFKLYIIYAFSGQSLSQKGPDWQQVAFSNSGGEGAEASQTWTLGLKLDRVSINITPITYDYSKNVYDNKHLNDLVKKTVSWIFSPRLNDFKKG